MLKSYFTEGENPASREALLRVVNALGLDAKRATEILDSDEYTAEVRARQRFYSENNINSVPAVIINDQYLISGGQPVEAFEKALLQIMQIAGESV
jgi:predicted DsbA family dithiol-disulfide isomerase